MVGLEWFLAVPAAFCGGLCWLGVHSGSAEQFPPLGAVSDCSTVKLKIVFVFHRTHSANVDRM